MNSWIKIAAAALALTFPGQAHAALIVLNLTGTVSNGSYSSQTIGTTTYDQFVLELDPIAAFTVAQGDMIEATVTLDQAFTIPASVQLTSFSFFLGGSNFPPIPTGASGTTAFFEAGNPGPSGSGSTTSLGQIFNGITFFPPNNGAITFDSLQSNFIIDTLSVPVEIDRTGISYTLFSPAAVPEPASWLMMILGFGMVGFAMRRRPQARVSHA